MWTRKVKEIAWRPDARRGSLAHSVENASFEGKRSATSGMPKLSDICMHPSDRFHEFPYPSEEHIRLSDKSSLPGISIECSIRMGLSALVVEPH